MHTHQTLSRKRGTWQEWLHTRWHFKLLLHLLLLWNSFESICTCRSSFLIRFDFVTSDPGRWIVPSAMRRSEFHFTSHHAFTFTLKTTQICSSSICKLSIRAQPLIPICRMVIFINKKREQQNLRDCSRLSKHDWARVTLPQAVCHPSVARWHPRSLLCLMFSQQLMSGNGRKREMH